ncbi:MAG: branched-chain amino acid ABC transporter permease [Deltaproteobacteria bacterium]|nr:branched-chain amino acid ABC transporter permease [Deltaproteobacteria bacterium]
MSYKRFYVILFLASGLFCLLPLVLDLYRLHVVIVSLFYVMMAASWNLIAGYTGQVSFAHAAFAGIGAYTSGILTVKAGMTSWLGVATGTLTAGVTGLGVGFLCLRMGGIYLSLTTLGFSEILRIIITNEYDITRGTMGLQIPPMIAPYSKAVHFFILLAGTLLTLIVVYKIIHSNMGLNFRAVQNDERAARSLGVNVIRVRVLAFAVSSALAGLAGAIYGHYLMLITPEIPSLDLQFFVLSMAVIGGLGSFAGPIIGSFALTILSEYIRAYGEYHVLVFGLVALAMARFAPQGIMGLARQFMPASGVRQ